MDIIEKENIMVQDAVNDWRESIVAAGKLLEDSGFISHEYTASMITLVDELGPYIVIIPGIAIAHAASSQEVYRNGISLLILKEPVIFGCSNDPVYLVFCLASTDGTSHLGSLKDLADMLQKEDFIERIKECADANEAFEIISDP